MTISGSAISETPISGLSDDDTENSASLRGTAVIAALGAAIVMGACSLQASASIEANNNLQLGQASLHATASIQAIPNFVLYASTREFITEPTDNLANQPFHGTLQRALRFSRSILNSGEIGQVTLGWGELEFINSEGDYDYLIEQYAIDGRRVVVRVGRAGDPYDDFMTVLDCTAADWHVDEDVLRVELRDNTYKLEVPAQPNIYEGTGGLEGGDDLKGKRRPRGFGYVDNATPSPLIPVEGVYEINDGQIQAVSAAYDNAVALIAATVPDYATAALLRAATTGPQGGGADIEAGEYATCLAEGLIRVGGDPNGRLTVSFEGDKLGGVFVSTHADIIRRVIGTATDVIDPTNLDEPSFDVVNAAQPAPIGYYLDENAEATAADVAADLSASMGGWAGFRRQGLFEVGIFDSPSGIPAQTYSRIDVISINREKLPERLTPPPYRYRAAWGRNWTVQADIAAGGTVTAARLAYLKDAFRLATSATADQTQILIDHPLAQDPPPIESFYRDEADADDEANRRLQLHGVTPGSLYRILLKSRPFVHEIGQVIELTYPRWDLVDGRLLRIVALDEDTDENTVELIGFG